MLKKKKKETISHVPIPLTGTGCVETSPRVFSGAQLSVGIVPSCSMFRLTAINSITSSKLDAFSIKIHFLIGLLHALNTSVLLAHFTPALRNVVFIPLLLCQSAVTVLQWYTQTAMHGVRFPTAVRIFLLASTSRPVLGPAQLSIQC